MSESLTRLFQVRFSSFEEGEANISSEVESEESCYESGSEFFEVEEFDITDPDYPYYSERRRDLPENYTIEDLGDGTESEIGHWTRNSEIMFSVESFKELRLDDDYDDDYEDKEGDSDASSVENIVIIDSSENPDQEANGDATSNNNKHVVVFAVSQEQESDYLASDTDEFDPDTNNTQISYDT